MTRFPDDPIFQITRSPDHRITRSQALVVAPLRWCPLWFPVLVYQGHFLQSSSASFAVNHVLVVAPLLCVFRGDSFSFLLVTQRFSTRLTSEPKNNGSFCPIPAMENRSAD